MLKEASDGLTKAWEVARHHEPFFDGEQAAISLDESKLICLFEENVVSKSWPQGNEASKLLDEDLEDLKESIICFCVHPNGKEVAVATRNGQLKRYDLETRTCVRSIRGHTMPVRSMAYDPTGTLVATGSADRSVRVWDMDKGFCTHSFKEHADSVQRVMFHPNPNMLMLFSTGDDNRINVYDLGSSERSVHCFDEHMSLPTALAVSPDGYILASVGRDQVHIQISTFDIYVCTCMRMRIQKTKVQRVSLL
jgi:U3 small nucleolar RNA-associated protein 13